MPFVILVAADLYGSKVNLELELVSRPSTLSALVKVIEGVFGAESAALRPDSASFVEFVVSELNLYREGMRGWTPLVNCADLYDRCQVYAVQRHVPVASGNLPRPRAPTPLVSSSSNANNTTTTKRRGSSPRTLSPPRAFSGVSASGVTAMNSALSGGPSADLLRMAAPNASNTDYPQYSPAPAGYNIPRGTSASAGNATLNQTAIEAINNNATLMSIDANTNINHRSASAAAATAASLTAKQRVFEDPNPSATHKIRTVFDELDTHSTRRVEHDVFRRQLASMRIDIPDGLASTVFRRADKDRDGTISMSEFEWLAEYYPTLVDAFYFRMKGAYEELRKAEIVEKRRRVMQEEHQREAQQQLEAHDIRRKIQELESSVLIHDQELKGKEIREREFQQKLAAAKNEVEEQKNLLKQREADVQAAKENEKERHQRLLNARTSVEEGRNKVSSLEADLSRAKEKEQQLLELLEMARKETDRAQHAVQFGVEEVNALRDVERQQADLFAESQKQVQRDNTLVTECDTTLDSLKKFCSGCEEQLLAAKREVAVAALRREKQEEFLRSTLDNDAKQRDIMLSVNSALNAAHTALEAAEAELRECRERRARIEAQEKPLIDEEIHLREQRFQLEENENRFRSETVHFYHTAGRPAHAASPMQHLGSSGGGVGGYGNAVYGATPSHQSATGALKY